MDSRTYLGGFAMDKQASAEQRTDISEQTGYEAPAVTVHKLEDLVLAGGASGADFLSTPNSQF